jgi:mRNA-degrading endonuclease RelE of RelBE toxin-antitoxin system
MYSIELAPPAVRDYKKLPQEEVERINEAVESLAGNPRPPDIKS